MVQLNRFLSKKKSFLVSFFICIVTNIFLVFCGYTKGVLMSRILGYFMLLFYYYFSVNKASLILTFYLLSALLSSALIYDYPVLGAFFALLYNVLLLFYCVNFYKFKNKANNISFMAIGISGFFLISIVSYGVFINLDDLLQGDFLFLFFVVLIEFVSIVTTLLIVVNLMAEFSIVNFSFFYGVVNLIIADVITALYEVDFFDHYGIAVSTIFRVLIGHFLIIYSAVLANNK